MIDFKAREHTLVSNAWELSAAFHKGAAWYRAQYRVLSFLTNGFNVVIVMTVVLKQKVCPHAKTTVQGLDAVGTLGLVWP